MRRLFLTWIYSLILLPAFAGSFGVYELLCEQKCNPVGIETQCPRFSWKISASHRGFVQAAYQVLVSDSEELLRNDEGNIWDSGKCLSEASLLIPFGGSKLRSSTRYYWKVRVWEANCSTSSEWSRHGTFVTGILNKKDWGASKWIALEKDDPAQRLVSGIHAPLVSGQIGNQMIGQYKLPVLRKEFQLKGDLRSAVVNISGLGHFDLFINGDKVGNHFLDPGWSYYSKTAFYVTFDVTDCLKHQNAIGIMLGNGFYNIPRERYFKFLMSMGVPKVKMNLLLTYKDGTQEEVSTDDTWRVRESPIVFSSIYGGEDYDATFDPLGWKQYGFDDSGWNRAVVVTSSANLIAQPGYSLAARDELPVVRKYKAGNGNLILDFGQNFSGIIRLRVKGKKGQKIIMKPGELLDEDKTVNQKASGEPYFWTYILRGEGSEEWQPQFTYYGFRYVEVIGQDSLKDIDIVGIHTTNAAPEVGQFSCSHPLFNNTYELIDWAMRSNLASVLTDCPHREKLGWLEVAHLMQGSLQYRFDLPNFYAQMMQTMGDSQTSEGFIPSISPEYVRFEEGFENSPEWGSAFIAIPWHVYKWYGDDSLIRTYYSQMKSYLMYLSARTENHILAYGLGDWFDLGPQSPGRSQLTSNGVTATAMYYYDIILMQQMAALLGKYSDASSWECLAEEVKEAYNRRFYHPEKGFYDTGSQTANAISLYMGLVDEANYSLVYSNLLADIRQREYAFTSGDIGYRFLLQVLEENGDSDVIYKMNSRYDVPGYGWQLAYGATALTESWQAYGFVSNNHCMLGHLMEWLFGGLGGIRQQKESVGYRYVDIKPQIPAGIRSSYVSYNSAYGEIGCEWQHKADGRVVMKVTIPANAFGRVYFPFSYLHQVREGGLPIDEAECCQLRQRGKERFVDVGSGTYLFEFF